MTATPLDGQSEPGAETDFEQTFVTGERCRLVLENVRGRVRVMGWEHPEVWVHASKRRGSCSDACFQATRVEAWQEGSAVTVRTVRDGAWPASAGGLWQDLAAATLHLLESLLHQGTAPAEVVYEVRVPRQAEVTLAGVSSDLVVEDVQGVLRTRTVSGACTVARARGNFDLSTVSGRLAGEALDGTLTAKSVSGDLRFAGRLDTLQANSVSGSVELAGPLARAGSYTVTTVSGNATLRVPPDTVASINARGVSLSVTIDLPHAVTQNVRQPGQRQWQGTVNGGGAAVRFNTVSGRLRLAHLAETSTSASAAQPAPEPVPADAPPARPAEARHPAMGVTASAQATAEPPAAEPTGDESAQLRILQALERGELAVDEALRRLEDLRDDHA
jgi:hypothetical protein